jgi:hypothetical protein
MVAIGRAFFPLAVSLKKNEKVFDFSSVFVVEKVFDFSSVFVVMSLN